MRVTTNRRAIATALYLGTAAAGGAAVYVARKVPPGTVALNRMVALLIAGACLVYCSTAFPPRRPEDDAEQGKGSK